MLEGAAMMDRLLSKRQKQMISSPWIASAPLILMSTQHEYQSVSLPTCYHRDSQHTSVWQEAVEDGRGSPCRHSLCQSVHCNVEQVSANLTQRHQSTARVSWRRWLPGQECWETDFVNVEPLGYMQVSAHTAPARSFSPSVAALKCDSSICLLFFFFFFIMLIDTNQINCFTIPLMFIILQHNYFCHLRCKILPKSLCA